VALRVVGLRPSRDHAWRQKAPATSMTGPAARRLARPSSSRIPQRFCGGREREREQAKKKDDSGEWERCLVGCFRVRWWHLALVAILLLGLVGCDHATKQLALTHLRDAAPFPIAPGIVEFSYTENRDMAFGLLQSIMGPQARYPVLVGMKVLGTLAAAGYLVARWGRSPWLEKAGLASIMAGAIGNLIDRVARGYVVDFIHVSFWPVFNVADVAICVGVALMFWAGARSALREPRGASP
jgi:signal peptidase II